MADVWAADTLGKQKVALGATKSSMMIITISFLFFISLTSGKYLHDPERS
jgi:hypothetical protein